VIIATLAIFEVKSDELLVKIIDDNGQPVSDIVVYAKPNMEVENLPVNKETLYIEQKGKKFSPYIAVMQKGQTINFVNKDDITHHIYSVSGENRFEFKIKAGVEKVTNPMLVTEEIAMGCNIHDWMSGYALVVDTPYFGKTNKQGMITFSLPKNAKYEVTAWHPQLDVKDNRVSQSITVNHVNLSTIITLPENLLPLPEQTGQDEFDFIEEY